MEVATMPRVKDTSTKKRVIKSAPVLGAAGLSFAMVGGASAAAVPTADVAMTPTLGTDQQLSLGVEEIADVSLATFYVFDKENTTSARPIHVLPCYARPSYMVIGLRMTAE